MRLEEAARYASEHGFDGVSTTLTVSPYQYTDIIREELKRAAGAHGIASLFEDFRPLYDEATRRSRELGMYRQNYCGCRFSDVEAATERAERKAQRAAAREAEAAAHAEERAAEKAEREQLEERFRLQFKNLATEILGEQSLRFKETSRESIDILLKPFKENIVDFRKRVEEIYTTQTSQRGEIGRAHV